MVAILKGAKCSIKIKVYDDNIRRHPIDLNKYTDFICAVMEDGKLLIEKKFSTNGIKTTSDLHQVNPYIVTIYFDPDDTNHLSLNPQDEERMRTLEVFGIGANDVWDRFVITDFNLEGSGYHVHRNRT